jgi:hypothetical protein
VTASPPARCGGSRANRKRLLTIRGKFSRNLSVEDQKLSNLGLDIADPAKFERLGNFFDAAPQIFARP